MKENQQASMYESSSIEEEQLEPNKTDDSILEKIATKTKEKRDAQKDDSNIPRHYPYQLIAKIIKCHSRYQAQVQFDLNGQTYLADAITTVILNDNTESANCILSFNQGDINQPMIMGLIQSEATDPVLSPIELYSEEGISLQCGSSRIELDENGTINIQGMHINSQAYGPHRIKGGSVKIN